MARDPRPRNDWSRQFDSVFKPRQFPGSRRGRFLIVFALFLIVEAAYVIVMGRQGNPITVAAMLWAAWLIVCLVWMFMPQFGAETDAPAHQRLARIVGMVVLGLGLLVYLAGVIGVLTLPVWWPVAVTSAAVAASALVLGVLELRPADPDRAPAS